MRLAELQYDLPEELIAQHPAEPRDASRLMVLHRDTGEIEHRTFRDIVGYLRAGDRLVRNNTRVLPARFFCRRATGGRVEALFLRVDDGRWRLLLRPSARLKLGERLSIENPTDRDRGHNSASSASKAGNAGRHCSVSSDHHNDAALILREQHERGEWTAQPDPPADPIHLLDRVGQPPLPPYIHRDRAPGSEDRSRYQTVYAAAPGAVAAPTAGLHFTPELLDAVRGHGVAITDVTLHVGLGTFAPIVADDLAEHAMHSEWYEVSPAAAAAIGAETSGRIVAVGTTSLRVLESLPRGPLAACSGWTDLFIYPPHEFKRVGALLTNFHLPGSTLLALVMAFGGVDNIRAAYQAAIAEGYRFFSYGDAMLVV